MRVEIAMYTFEILKIKRWRRHIHLTGTPPDQVMFAWEDVKAMFNGGSRKRVAGNSPGGSNAIPVVTSTSSSSAGERAVAKPIQDETQTKPTKTLKNSCGASKRPKFENGPLPKIRQPVEIVSAAGTSTSGSPGPNPTPSPSTPQNYHHPINQPPQTLLARLNSIVPTAGSLLAKPSADSPLQDYSMMWSAAGTGRFWSPYLNPLPFHPYSYYNYLINKTDQFSLIGVNPSGGGGWQQLVSSKPRLISPSPLQKIGLLEDNSKSLQVNPPIEEEDGETFVDVESTDPAIAN